MKPIDFYAFEHFLTTGHVLQHPEIRCPVPLLVKHKFQLDSKGRLLVQASSAIRHPGGYRLVVYDYKAQKQLIDYVHKAPQRLGGHWSRTSVYSFLRQHCYLAGPALHIVDSCPCTGDCCSAKLQKIVANFKIVLPKHDSDDIPAGLLTKDNIHPYSSYTLATISLGISLTSSYKGLHYIIQ